MSGLYRILEMKITMNF